MKGPPYYCRNCNMRLVDKPAIGDEAGNFFCWTQCRIRFERDEKERKEADG